MEDVRAKEAISAARSTHFLTDFPSLHPAAATTTQPLMGWLVTSIERT